MQQKGTLDLKEYEIYEEMPFNDDFSNFYKVQNRKTGEIYMAQVFNKYDTTRLKEEADHLIQLSYPSIINFIGYSLTDFTGRNNFVLVTQYPRLISLGDIIHSESRDTCPDDWEDTKKLINIFGIASGMSYLHSQNILIRELCPNLILEDKNLYPKIFNFGFSTLKNEENKKDLTIQFSAENWFFTAPEILEDGLIYSKSDVFSFGMIVYYIYSGHLPFDSNSQFDYFHRIINGERPELNFDMPECYKKLIRSCWANNPDERPSFDEIVDIIKNTPEFITDYIDEAEFNRYVEYIESKGVKHASIDLIENDIMDENKEEEMPLKLNVKLLELRNFEKKEKISFGTFGKVYKIQEKLTGQLFAAKITKKIITDKMKDTTTGKGFIQEVEILSSLDHPGIVKFIGYSPINFKKKLKPSIVIEYLKNDSLEKLLELERRGLDIPFWNDTMRLINIYGIAYSMRFLHSLNIIHRDLKPDNIILDKYLFPKLSDFGLSVRLNDKSYFEKEIVGTPSFISPEIFSNLIYSKSCDVYAFGMLVYEVMNRKYPFLGCGELEMMRKVSFNKERPLIDIKKVPKRYKELIEKCWSDNPEDRPTFDEIVEELKNDPGFITKEVDKDKFLKYQQFIENKKFDMRKFPFNSYELSLLHKEFGHNFLIKLDGKGFIDVHKYEKAEEMQHGMLSSVFKIREKKSGIFYTAKISKVRIDNYSKEEISELSKEVEVLKGLKHPSIQKFLGYSFCDFKEEMKPVVISEFYTSKTLHDIIKVERKGQTYSGWNFTKKLINIYGIASAMQYLHKHGIFHPNLSLKNIFVDDNFYPKLSEIGQNTQIENNKTMSILSTRERDFNAIQISPEILKNEKNNEKSDVYSYSMIVYEIMTNEIPFKNIDNEVDLYNKVVKNKSRPIIKESIPYIYRYFMEICWSDEPEKRPSFDIIVSNLEKNREFITAEINSKEYFKYVKYVSQHIDK